MNGKNGNSAINFSGFSGKTVVINNNSIIKGGDGGNAYTTYASSCNNWVTYGGAGGSWKVNYGAVSITFNGNSPTNGTNGANGNGADYSCN
jgi:hypothetical protein